MKEFEIRGKDALSLRLSVLHVVFEILLNLSCRQLVMQTVLPIEMQMNCVRCYLIVPGPVDTIFVSVCKSSCLLAWVRVRF